eukprot:gnl/Hemi2/13913_TR4721_c0_g1_i1.p1 gnl/Hemi2/13913_TR4721_c0_g1~~gnl/Hemi2/13913_TR4721_c0_g1_i1.p1  ORF type:complete len:344 (+),score=139.63 gnl/Hemi2/13913_TR4721_c0_g1_i1:166-1197(+)
MNAMMDNMLSQLNSLVGKDPATDAKPDNTNFKQQKYWAWQPVLTANATFIALAVTGIIFLTIGIIVLSLSNQVHEEVVPYNHLCFNHTVCDVVLEIGSTWQPPIFFYYQLENYYQNHRRYVHSRDDHQLEGDFDFDDTSIRFHDCDPKMCQVDGENVDNCTVRYPCGLIAASVFNDTFKIFSNGPNNTLTDVNFNDTGIAWESDRDVKFHYPKDPEQRKAAIEAAKKNGVDIESEHFITWMRVAGLPKFRKLYARLNEPLKEGNYTVRIGNYYPVDAFVGKKAIVFSTTTMLGGKNTFLGFSYVVGSLLCIGFSLLFMIKSRTNPRTIGDVTFLDRVNDAHTS